MMAIDIFVHKKEGKLLPCSKEDAEKIAGLPDGKPLKVNVTQTRNYQRHKRAMALLRLTFDYWEPDSLVTHVERNTVHKLADMLVSQGISYDAVTSVCSAFFDHLERVRGTTEAEKSFDAFREYVTIKSGFFNVIQTPTGLKKEAKSWAFANMDEQQFLGMYSALFNTCWQMALSRQFETMEDADKAAMEMVGFS